MGASMFSKESRHLESNKIFDKQLENCIYAMGAVNFSFSAIEATINEFYKNIADNKTPPYITDNIDGLKIKLLSELWPHLNMRKTFEMYQTALSILINKKYTDTKKGKELYDKACDLQFLRNAVIHFEPEDSLSQYKHEKIQERLEKYNIKNSVFYEKSQNPYFPDKCLGHGICEWSLKTALDFILYFYKRLGIKELAKIYETKP